ncbi:MAG TPA: translation initiation factor IF-3 [Streptosporangiaceae bacterium]|nr:translation initiation factor IF-3 [Streptosporangiaceae bacterium]
MSGRRSFGRTGRARLWPKLGSARGLRDALTTSVVALAALTVAPHASHAGLSRFRTGGDASEPAGIDPAGTISDAGGHISTEPRINERIRVPEVRLVGPSGEQVGIVSINDALRLAQEADLDLVEVAPTARPPVCKLMDYGKFKYESALKARESRKNQAQTVIKEIKIRPKIDPHDYGTKKGHVERFLKAGDKVKVTIMFRGREQSRPELGYKLLQRLAGDVEELGFVESQPKQDGRNMIMVIGPHRKKADTKPARVPDRASARASAPTADHAGSRPAPAPSRAAVASPVSHNSQATSAPGPAATTSAAPRPAAPRPGQVGSPRPAAPRPASSAAQAAPRPAAQAAPRPTAPRPAPSGAQASPRPAPPASQAAPRPGPPSGGPRPTAPKPAAPRPAQPAAAQAAQRPPAPKPAAPRPAAPRPAAPRAKPDDVPSETGG